MHLIRPTQLGGVVSFPLLLGNTSLGDNIVYPFQCLSFSSILFVFLLSVVIWISVHMYITVPPFYCLLYCDRYEFCWNTAHLTLSNTQSINQSINQSIYFLIKIYCILKNKVIMYCHAINMCENYFEKYLTYFNLSRTISSYF